MILGLDHRAAHFWLPIMRAECLSPLIFRYFGHLSLTITFPGWPAP